MKEKFEVDEVEEFPEGESEEIKAKAQAQHDLVRSVSEQLLQSGCKFVLGFEFEELSENVQTHGSCCEGRTDELLRMVSGLAKEILQG